MYSISIVRYNIQKQLAIKETTMVINATQVRVGMILVINETLYQVTWCMHRTPGKGDACMQTKLKNIKTGKNSEFRFRSSDKVEKASLSSKAMQYLYADGDGFVFMDNESFEQITLLSDLISGREKFLTEGSNYDITFFEKDPVGLALPKTMSFNVVTAPPEIKKATANSSLRPITLENDMVVQAPGFIK